MVMCRCYGLLRLSSLYFNFHPISYNFVVLNQSVLFRPDYYLRINCTLNLSRRILLFQIKQISDEIVSAGTRQTHKQMF